MSENAVTQKDKFARQSFLGADCQSRIESCIVGIVGAGGGGSHIVQQLAHIGFTQYVIYDNDTVEYSNLNRMVGAKESDVPVARLKIDIARRMIQGLSKKAKIDAYSQRWQENSLPLHGCDIVFGCLDTFKERQELEACCRRYLIPYVDIGMDVHQVGNEPPVMAGQIILSLPGDLCMFCLGFLTKKISRKKLLCMERLAAAPKLFGQTAF